MLSNQCASIAGLVSLQLEWSAGPHLPLEPARPEGGAGQEAPLRPRLGGGSQ